MKSDVFILDDICLILTIGGFVRVFTNDTVQTIGFLLLHLCASLIVLGYLSVHRVVKRKTLFFLSFLAVTTEGLLKPWHRLNKCHIF